MAEPIRQVLTRTLTLTAVVAVFSAGCVRTASAVSDFRTPGYAAYCGISHGERPYALICWTPRDGFTLDMREGGTAGKRYEPKNIGFHDVVGRELRFGGHGTSVGLGSGAQVVALASLAGTALATAGGSAAVAGTASSSDHWRRVGRLGEYPAMSPDGSFHNGQDDA